MVRPSSIQLVILRPDTGTSVSFPISNRIYMEMDRLRSGRAYCLSNGDTKWCFRPYYRKLVDTGGQLKLTVFASEVVNG